MPRKALQRPDPLPSIVTRGAAAVSPMTTRYDDDQVIAWRVGDVVIDLARAEPADVGAAVDLAQPDSTSSDATRSHAAGHSSAPIGCGGLLSPSWPSAIRLTNAFGTADLINDREGPRP